MSHHSRREESGADNSYTFTADDIRRLEDIQHKLSPGGRKVIDLILGFFNKDDGRLNFFKLLEFGQLMAGKAGLNSESLSALNLFETGNAFPLAELLQGLIKESSAKPNAEEGQ